MIKKELKNGKYKLTFLPSSTSNDFSFKEEQDKFLFDRYKTVGFRKDKKIHKFVGIRDGHSKQLEFTLKSIVLDGNEKISKNRVNFNSIGLIGNDVVHTIGNTRILNNVDNTNFKNMVEVNDPFNSLEIIYQVHLKGIKISNNFYNNKYYVNGYNQFNFIDDGNNELIFVIDVPVAIDDGGNHHQIIEHRLYIEDDVLYYKKKLNKVSDKYDFPLLIDTNIYLNNLNSNGVGVIQSSGSTWNDAYDGTNLQIIHNSSSGTFNKAVGLTIDTGSTSYIINRTFLNYDTSSFSSQTDVLASVKLLIHNYLKNDEVVTLYKGTQSSTLSTSDWDQYSDYIDDSELKLNDITEFNLPFEYFSTLGETKFVLKSINDISGLTLSGITSYSGLDFNKTELEVVYEPIKVYGQTEINVIKGSYFELKGYVNSGSTDDIEWYSDSGYSNFISSGHTFSDYSMEYIKNNKVYAVLPLNGGGYSDPLIITINVIELDYSILPKRYNRYDVIDIDSMYFKYHKCLDGVCYNYVRDLDNIYENTLLVSDSVNAYGVSYNLYNEFDIIDDFFNNSHEIDVAYDKNLDLTKRYNELDGAILREGGKVLLTNQNDLNEIGIYVVKYDNRLIKTNELDTLNKMFRYKAHIKSGKYADKEIHIGLIEEIFNLIDSNIYDIFVYNSNTYGILVLDSNI